MVLINYIFGHFLYLILISHLGVFEMLIALSYKFNCRPSLLVDLAPNAVIKLISLLWLVVRLSWFLPIFCIANFDIPKSNWILL